MTQLYREVKKLYDQDFVLWVDETVKQLQGRDLDNLDWGHLIEEIEGLGSEQRHKVDSYLVQLLIHLLLYRHWETEREWCQNGWKNEIGNCRLQLDILLESKTLYNYFLQRIYFLYPKARKRVIEKTELSPERFPEECPFTPEQILDSKFFPH